MAFGSINLSQCYRPIEGEIWDYLVEKCQVNDFFMPFFNNTLPKIKIALSFDLWRFYEIVDRTETMSLLGSLNMKWQHPCAKWNSNDSQQHWENVKYLTITPDQSQLWLPMVQHINSKQNDAGIIQGQGTVLSIRNDGTFIWYITTVFESNCAMGIFFEIFFLI